jgi:type II secretory pathway pseudopilin PulG
MLTHLIIPSTREIKSRQQGICQGFAYLALLIVLALLSISVFATLTIFSLQQKRDAEEELLAIGMELSAALTSYANTTPVGGRRYPSNLQELLRDTRTPIIRRHLRKIYIAPITKQVNWGLVMSTDGTGIIGVYSRSNARPIKIKGFPSIFKQFEGQSNSYQDWVFLGGELPKS